MAIVVGIWEQQVAIVSSYCDLHQWLIIGTRVGKKGNPFWFNMNTIREPKAETLTKRE